MAEREHVERLHQAVEAWNGWRRVNPAHGPDLSGEDLSGPVPPGINLGEADLDGAGRSHTGLTGADLKMVRLRRADLSGVPPGRLLSILSNRVARRSRPVAEWDDLQVGWETT